MFFWDAWFRWKRSEAFWVIVLRAIVAFILLVLVVFFAALLGFNVAGDTTFFQLTEIAPDADGIPPPDIHICYSTPGANVIVSQSVDSRPPNGSVGLGCGIQVGNQSSFQPGWLTPLPTPLPFESPLGKCFHLRAAPNFRMANFSLGIVVSLPEDANLTLPTFTILLLDYDFDPYLPLYGLSPPGYTVIDERDLDFFKSSGSYPGVPRFRNVLTADSTRTITAYFHRNLIYRNLVDRGLWRAFNNYLGLWPLYDKVETIDVWAAGSSPADTQNPLIFWLAPDINTITIQKEVRVYTFLGALSSFGGFYGLIAGIYIILFGGRPIPPWGIVQKWAIGSSKRVIQTKFCNAFLTSTGVPLRDKLDPNRTSPMGQRDIEERLRAIEDILGEYYLDTKFVKKVKNGPFEKAISRMSTIDSFYKHGP